MRKIALLSVMAIVITVITYSCNSNNTSDDSLDASQKCNCYTKGFPKHKDATNPLDDSTSSFWTKRTNTNNCMFHQFSVQKFLWLTRTMPSGRAYFEDSLIQVTVTLDSFGSGTLMLIDTAQAGSQGSLRTNYSLSQDKKEHLVYYNKYVNKKMYNACVDFEQKLKDTSTRKLNGYTFPNGSLELKAAWVNVKALPASDTNNYYRTNAIVWLDCKGNKSNERVALVGMHVVTKVINHPEFIWATFEHHNLASYYDWTTANDTITSNKDLLFFSKGYSVGLSGITWQTNPVVIRPTPCKAFSVFKYGTPRDPGKDVFMKYTSQSPTAANKYTNSDSINYANITAINESLQSHLGNQSSDVWKNYFYNGAIWLNTDNTTAEQQVALIQGMKGTINIDTSSAARGSLACKNITMETYTQVFKPLNGLFAQDTVVGNCFGCHNGSTTVYKKDTMMGYSPLYFSHLFNHYLRNKSIPNSCQKEHDAKQTDLISFIKKAGKNK